MELLIFCVFNIFESMILSEFEEEKNVQQIKNYDTVCPRSSDPIYIVSYYIKWVTTSWTYSIHQGIKTKNYIILRQLRGTHGPN